MMRASTILATLMSLSACSSDQILEVSRTLSPDGRVAAIYRIYHYGGAAGGVGHCISVGSAADVADTDCDLLASHISGVKLEWKGDVLLVHYEEASITQFRNEIYLAEGSRASKRYEIQLVGPSI